jgi:hypothetical protein
MTTETLIKRLRSFLPPGPLALEIMIEAAARLESIQWELTQAIAERTPHDYGLLKEEATFLRKERDEARAEVRQLRATVAAYEQATVNQQLTVRSEPSRLEIAAMAMHGMLAASSFDTLRLSRSALEAADALIAAAKKSK